MDTNLTIQELIKIQKLPTTSAQPLKSNRELYSTLDIEDAVCPPEYAPIGDAFIYYSKKGKTPWFRKSESEPTYSKSALKRDFGMKSNDFQGIIPFDSAYSDKLKAHYDLYCLSSFKKYKNISPSFPNWYRDLEQLLSYAPKRTFVKLHSASDFHISVAMKSIQVKFKQFTIVHRVSLKELCQQRITRTSSSPKEDLRQQVVLPLAKMIEQFKDDFLNQLSELIHVPETNIEVASLDKREIKQAISDFVSQLRREKDKQLTHKALMSQKPYHELFPCRGITRNITVYIAPTNSGKTYQACNEIKEMISTTGNNTAQCFFPLRALAAQLKDEFVQDGFPCDLITGEEREYEPDARITCCTTEIIDPGSFRDLMFIDECQMIFDHNKQAAYTRAILGAYCHELKLAVAPYFADALIEILHKYTNDTINIVKLERLCPLSSCGDMTLNDIEKGDVVVAYRTKSIHLIAESLRNNGFKVGVIYGRMSPSARRSMIKGFMDKGCDCLVATDAIGMGLSIPAKRVLIAEGTKYDGISVRPLEDEEMRQVAGRAGRYGFYDEGFYGTLDISSIMEDNHRPAELFRIDDAMVIREAFKASMDLSVLPDKNILRSVEDLNLEATLNVWKDSVTSHENITVCKENFDYLVSKAIFLDACSIEDRETLVSLLFIVFPEDKDNVWQRVYQSAVTKVAAGKILSFDDYYMIETSGYRSDITDFEDMSMYLTLLSQFQRVFPDLCPDEQAIMDKQDNTGELLSALLLKLYASA